MFWEGKYFIFKTYIVNWEHGIKMKNNYKFSRKENFKYIQSTSIFIYNFSTLYFNFHCLYKYISCNRRRPVVLTGHVDAFLRLISRSTVISWYQLLSAAAAGTSDVTIQVYTWCDLLIFLFLLHSNTLN